MSHKLKHEAKMMTFEAQILRKEERKRKMRCKTYHAYQLDKARTRLLRMLDESVSNDKVDEKYWRIARMREHILKLSVAVQQPPIEPELAKRLNSEREEMHRFRTHELRKLARSLNIARGFMRGRSYIEIEGLKNHTRAPNNGVYWECVHRYISDFGSEEHKVNFQIWLAKLQPKKFLKASGTD